MSGCMCRAGGKDGDYQHSDYCPIEKDRRIKELETELAPLEGRRVIDHIKYTDNLEQKVKELRRHLDNIKVRSYELGQRELHDMALSALKESGA